MSPSRVVRQDTTLPACLAAARKMHRSLQHALADSEVTLGDTVSLDKIAPVTRACGARFTLANTPKDDLDSLFQLALYEQNDTLAQSIVDKLLPSRMAWVHLPKLPPGTVALMPKSSFEPDSGGSYLADVMLAYTDFGRLAAAAALETQVSRKGPSDYFFQLQYHFSRESRLAQQKPRDDAQLLQEIEQVLHITETRVATTDSTKLDYKTYTANWHSFAYLFDMLWWQHADSATVWRLAARVKRDMVRYRYATEMDHFSHDVVVSGCPTGNNDDCSLGHWPGWETLTLREVLHTENTGGWEGHWVKRWP